MFLHAIVIPPEVAIVRRFQEPRKSLRTDGEVGRLRMQGFAEHFSPSEAGQVATDSDRLPGGHHGVSNYPDPSPCPRRPLPEMCLPLLLIERSLHSWAR